MRQPSDQALREFLRSYGPALSSTVQAHLAQAGTRADAARKRIQRAGNGIEKISGLRLPHNEGVLFLREQYGSPRFWEGLLNALDQAGSAYGFAFRSLEARGGIVPHSHFDIVSGSPARLRSQLSSDHVLKKLIALRLLETFRRGDSEYVMVSSRVDPDVTVDVRFAQARAQQIAEDILLLGLREWLRKIGLVSFNRVTLRSETSPAPSFAQFGWDLVAPSYIGALRGFDEGGAMLPGFFVADVVLRGQLSESQIRYFLRKAKIIEAQRSSRPFIAMLMADGFTEDALRRGRSAGLLLTTPDHFLGSDIATSLRELVRNLSHAAETAALNPDALLGSFTKLAKIEGAAGNLRGFLFEMIVGHCVLKQEGHTIDIGKLVTDPESGQRAEIDVLRVKEDQEVCLYECKGVAGGTEIPKSVVEEWFKTKRPKVSRWLAAQERFRHCRREYAFWTTGTLSHDAIEYLSYQQRSMTKSAISWRDGKAVLEYARGVNSTAIVKALNEHYLEHPFADDRALLTQDVAVN